MTLDNTNVGVPFLTNRRKFHLGGISCNRWFLLSNNRNLGWTLCKKQEIFLKEIKEELDETQREVTIIDGIKQMPQQMQDIEENTTLGSITIHFSKILD